ncbi:MAG: malate dehydrogenase, partial [Gammaproteobacteria bacterium]|nr:malate dehydrogenase [Gammaproteobacteria bacterium]
TSSAYAAPGAAIGAMVDAIAHDRKRVLPCVAVLAGEYGQQDVAMGVPVILGRQGIDRIVELRLSADEAEQIRQSAAAIRRDLDRLRVAA